MNHLPEKDSNQHVCAQRAHSIAAAQTAFGRALPSPHAAGELDARTSAALCVPTHPHRGMFVCIVADGTGGFGDARPGRV